MKLVSAEPYGNSATVDFCFASTVYFFEALYTMVVKNYTQITCDHSVLPLLTVNTRRVTTLIDRMNINIQQINVSDHGSTTS